MKVIHILFLLLLASLGCQTPMPKEQPKKAVFIILDGIPADVLERVGTPTLDEIAAAGGYTRAYVGGDVGQYNQTPTISAPGYMDLLTATWANKHNVWDNYNQSPNYHYWNLFRIAKNAAPALPTAIFSTWLDNRTVLIGDGKPEAGGRLIDYAADGYELDTLRFPHDTAAAYILNIDELVAETAGKHIAEQAPGLSWVYLEHTDDVGHALGDGTLMDEAVKRADAQVKKIWDAVKVRQQKGEDWMIVVTTDHGRDAVKGMDHGGQTDRERTTWIVTNAKNLNERFGKEPLPITDIAPSILKHLGMAPPEAIAFEMDGVPFVGAVSVADLRVKRAGDRLQLSWKVFDEAGDAEVQCAFTNYYKTGEEDVYEKMGHFPVKDGAATIPLNAAQWAAFEKSGIIKIVLKAPGNVVNRWLVENSPE